MKKITSLLFLTISLSCTAQNVFFSETEITLDFNESMLFNTVFIENPGTDTVKLAVTLESLCYLPDDDTHISLHLNGLHMLPVNQTTTWDDPFFILAPGESSGLFEIEQLPAGSYGTTWNLIFFEQNNPDNADTLFVTIHQDECSVGVYDFAEELQAGTAFPNPAIDQFTIPYQIEQDANLVICNTLGQIQEVETISHDKSETKLDILDWPEGIYYYYLRDGNLRSRAAAIVVGY